MTKNKTTFGFLNLWGKQKDNNYKERKKKVKKILYIIFLLFNINEKVEEKKIKDMFDKYFLK